ncbi:hypothetical protein SKAU_G00044290 [Synaphobranchus kaupii]|uniref:AIG1-type G domain-containing protein n=1 Tax=Synaphobranchus kaupii TaxID=118154 RepID=A0A9Q1G1S5_SYNKA|nr:hypothetical protein SKAU_G00044290 [Synaphobranchus kaupii]
MDNQGSSSICGREHQRSELRIVLLGGRCSGKSSAGNTILGKEDFPTGVRTSSCAGRQGEGGARRVTVVDTPGWWCDFYAQDTPELIKQEVVWRGVSLCPPGPHVFLLVIKASSPFTEKRRRAVEEHLQLFGGRVWEHTVVLFTWADRLGDATIDQHINKQGKALRWLIEKCGNRYHVLNSKSQETDAQVTEMLAKVDEMVKANSGRHYEIDRKALEEGEERRMAVNERVKQRLAEVRKQRSLLTASLRGLSELRIVLVGARLAGKSSAGNCILGRSVFQTGVRTASCVVRQGQAAGRRVTVIDTPGWWMNYFAGESPEYDKQEVRRSVCLCPPGPHALVVLVRADRSFSSTHGRALAEHLELLGAAVWRHALLVFTFGDWLGDEDIERHIENEGEALRRLVEKCGNRYHVLSNRNGADGAQVTRLLERIEETVAGNGGLHYQTSDILQEVEERRQAVEERAKERMRKVQGERADIRSLLPGGVPTLSDLTIVLLGSVGAGKSSAGNTILGREVFEAGQRTERWQKRQGETCGKSVTVLDTPGWRTDGSDAAELGEGEIWGGPSLRSLRPNALLLAVNVSSSFTETHGRAADKRLELLGKGAWSRASVLFTNGDWLGDTTIERRIESEGGALRWLVEKCGNRYHVLNNKSKGDDSQVAELLEKIEEMEAGRREGTQEQWKEEEEEEEEQEITVKFHEQHLEEEQDKDPPLAVCGFSGHHRCMTKTGSSGKIFEKHDSLRLHITPLLSLVLLSTSRPANSDGESHMPGGEQVASEAHKSGPSRLIERDPRDDAGRQLVKAAVLDPSSRKPQSLLLLMSADQLKALNWKALERTGEVLGNASAERVAVLLGRAEVQDESTAEEPGQTGSGDIQRLVEEHGGKSTIEELELFIDACLETVRDGGVESPAPAETQHGDCTCSLPLASSQHPARAKGGRTEADYRSLASTGEKVSALNILEAMQRRLMEMDQTLQHSCQIIQELRETSEEAHSSSVKRTNDGEPGESPSRNGSM